MSRIVPVVQTDSSSRPARGAIIAIGIFLVAAAGIVVLAAITLLAPGTFLDAMWKMNPAAYRQMAPMGAKAGILFLILGAALLAAAIGWFRRRRWGWWLTVVIFAVQVLGDLDNAIQRDHRGGAIGVLIAGALLVFLWHPRIRSAFD